MWHWGGCRPAKILSPPTCGAATAAWGASGRPSSSALSRWNPIFAAVSVETLIGQHQAEHYAALNAGNREATCTPFIEFMLAMIRDTLRDMLATEQQTEQVRRLLAAMDTAPLSAREIMAKVGLKHRPTFLYSYLRPALADGLIEMTRPDVPRARNQKYRKTAKGRCARL